MTIPDFIRRCDAYCADFGVSRVWLSKKLFSDTFRLDELEAGSSDVGVRRLARACADLDALTDKPGSHGASAPVVDDAATMAPAPAHGADNRNQNITRTGEAA